MAIRGSERADPEAEAFQVFLKNNVKTLGYHLAQQLAKDLPLLPIAGMPANVGLKSKACTQSDIESAWFVYWCHQLKRAPSNTARCGSSATSCKRCSRPACFGRGRAVSASAAAKHA